MGIRQKVLDTDQTVPHNQFAPISARAWLRYQQTHASRKIMQVR